MISSSSYKLQVVSPIADVIRRQRVVETVLSRLDPALKFTASNTDQLLRDGSSTALSGLSPENAQQVAETFERAGVSVKIVNQQAASQLPSFGWRSLRWRLLGAALLPLGLIGGLWLFDTLTAETSAVRRLVLEGGVQSTDFLSDRISSIAERNGGKLDLVETQQILKDLVSAAVLPVDFAVVTDQHGKTIAAYDVDFMQAKDPANPVAAFKQLTSDESAIVEAMASETAVYQDPPSGQPNFSLSGTDPLARSITTASGERLLLVGHPVESTGGALLISLHSASIDAHINASVRNTFLALGAALLVSLLAAWLFARGLIGRLLAMSQSANQISMGQFDVPIDSRTPDEIGEVGRAMDRMRASLETAIARLSRR